MTVLVRTHAMYVHVYPIPVCHIRVPKLALMHVHTYSFMCVYMSVYVCMYVCMHACMYVCMCVYVCTYVVCKYVCM